MDSWRPPWEGNGLMGFILGDGDLLPNMSPSILPPTPASIAISVMVDQIVTEPGVAVGAEAGEVLQEEETAEELKPAKRARVAKETDESERRWKILRAWVVLLVSNACHFTSELTNQMTADGEDEFEVVRLSFFKKRTATLAARLGPLVKLLRYAKLMSWQMITERNIYDYMVANAGIGEPATRATQLMQSLNFLIHVCKATSLRKALSFGERLQGFAAEQLSRLGTRQQARAFSASFLEVLEFWVVSKSLPIDELLVAGAALILVSSRGRFRDLSSAIGLIVGSTTFEVQVSRTKTSGSIGDRLPLFFTCPKILLSGQDWLAAYLQFRLEIDCPWPKFPLFPAYVSGSYVESSGRLQDFNRGLRVLSARAQVGFSISSHSCKATLLSWAGRYGLNSEVRAALGHHTGGTATSSVRSYSRDKQQAPVAAVCKMLAEMRERTFKPEELEGDLEQKPGEFLEGLVSEEIVSPTQMWGEPVDSDQEDVVGDPAGCSPTADFVPGKAGTQLDSESDSDQSNGRIYNSDSEVSDREGEVWTTRESDIVSGLHILADCRIFKSQTGKKKLHRGRPGDPTKTLCGNDTSSMLLQASGEAEASDDFCLRCTRVVFSVRKKQEKPGAPLVIEDQSDED